MSAVTILDERVSQRRTSSRRPTYADQRPNVVMRARLEAYPRARRKAKVNTFQAVVSKTALLVCIAVGTYGASTMSGQVMVEQSRRDGQRALSRTQTAERMETALRARLDDLLRPDVIDAWAKDHGFVPHDIAPSAASPERPAGTLVASRN